MKASLRVQNRKKFVRLSSPAEAGQSCFSGSERTVSPISYGNDVVTHALDIHADLAHMRDGEEHRIERALTR